MSSATTNGVAVAGRDLDAVPPVAVDAASLAAGVKQLGKRAWYAAAPAEHQDLLRQDLARCLADGLPLAEYLEGLDHWMAGTNAGCDVKGYLQESNLLAQDEEYEAAVRLNNAAAEPAAVVAGAVQQTAEEAAYVPPTVQEICRMVAAVGVAQQQAEAERAELTEQAEDRLTRCVKAYRAGEKEYRVQTLKAGQMAHEYVVLRLTLGATREQAVKVLNGRLAEVDGQVSDANELIRCWAAYDLLAVQPELAADKKARAAVEAVPYGRYKEGYSQLVQRVDADTAGEHWILLPGMEDACKAAYFQHTTAAIGQGAVKQACKVIQRDYAAAVAKAADESRRQAEADRKLAEAAASESLRETQRLAAEKLAQEQEMAAAAPADKAVLAETLQVTADALRAKQEEQACKVREMEAARKEEDRRQHEAVATQKQADKAAAKAEPKASKPKAEKAAAPAVQPAECIQANLLKAASKVGKEGTAKDVAALALELVTGGDAPDDVLHELMLSLRQHKDLSKGSHRAIEAFLVRLQEPKQEPRGIAIPSTNGHAELAKAG